jgi:hypothetical protein
MLQPLAGDVDRPRDVVSRVISLLMLRRVKGVVVVNGEMTRDEVTTRQVNTRVRARRREHIEIEFVRFYAPQLLTCYT